ncbi:MAG: hypothetical protein LBG13_00665 [Holosporales bacterium]|nr:hypothetical protein [Holosporales bacterium]
MASSITGTNGMVSLQNMPKIVPYRPQHVMNMGHVESLMMKLLATTSI